MTESVSRRLTRSINLMPQELQFILNLLLSPEGLVATTLVSVVTIRFFVTLKRGLLDLSISTVRQAWLMWGVFFCMAAASVFHLINMRFGANSNTLSWLWAAILAIVSYILISAISVEISPLRPRWNWPILGGALTVIVILLAIVWLPASSAFFSEYGFLIGHFFFAIYLFVVVFRLAVPAFYWSYTHETQPPMKIRFALMVITNIAVAVWMVNSLTDNICRLMGWPYNQDPVYYALLLILLPSFVLSYLLPASYFVKFVVLTQYFADLVTLWMMRQLENKIAQMTHTVLAPLGMRDWLLTPGSSIYCSAIAIFDSRKRLAQAEVTDARKIAADIERVARPDLSYPVIVSQLRQIWLYQAIPWLNLDTSRSLTHV